MIPSSRLGQAPSGQPLGALSQCFCVAGQNLSGHIGKSRDFQALGASRPLEARFDRGMGVTWWPDTMA